MSKLIVRVILAVFCFVFVASGFFSPIEAKVEKISFITWSNTETFDWIWKKFVEDYPEYKSIKYESRSVGGQSQDMMKNLMVTYASGAETPDICEMNFKLNPMLVEAGVAAEITKYVQPSVKYLPKVVLDSATYKGKIYGFPLRGNSTMMLYRKDLFEKAGIKESDVKTWKGFVESGKKLSSQLKGVYMTSVDPVQPGWTLSETLLGQHGIGFFDKDGDTLIDKNKGATESLKLINDMVKLGIAMPVREMTPPWYAALGDGKIACIPLAGWMPKILANNVPGGAGKWQAVPYPTFSNGKQSMQGVMGYTILTKDKEKQALLTKAIANIVNKPENAMALENATALNASYKYFLDNPPKIPLFEKYFPGQDIKRLDIQLLSNALLHKYTPAYSEALNIVNIELSKAVNGSKDIDTAIKDMATTIRRQIGNSKY